jgi:putative aldouronate transport system substrate-binding protein
MKKVLLAWLLIFALVVTACSGATESTETTETETADTNTDVEQAEAEKKAAEEAAAQAQAELDAAKAAEEQAKADAEKAAAEKAEAERLLAEAKTADEKAAAEKILAETVAAEQAAAAALAKATAEQAAAQQAAAQKAAAQQVAAQKAAAQKAAAQKAATTNTTTNSGTTKQPEVKDSNFNPTGLPIVKTPIKLTVMYPRKPLHADFETMWFTKEIQRLTNIDLDFIAVEQAGWEERKKLAFATGDLPDIFLTGITAADEQTFGPQGLLTPLNDLMKKYAPNATNLFSQYESTRKSFTFPDGSIYVAPYFKGAMRDNIGNTTYFNKAWLNKLGLSEPKTLNDLYTVLKAFKEKDPNGNGKADEIPMSGSGSGTSNIINTGINILQAFGIVDPRHDVIGNKYTYVPLTNEYKEYITYMNRLYDEKLLDPEFFTHTADQLRAKVADQRVGMWLGIGPQTALSNNDYLNYGLLPLLTGGKNNKPVLRKQYEYFRLGTFAITNKAKHKEAAIRLLDLLYSDEGALLVRTGPEVGKWEGKGGYIKNKLDPSSFYAKKYPGLEGYTPSFSGYNSFFEFRHSVTIMDGPMFANEKWVAALVGADARNVFIENIGLVSEERVKALREPYPEVKFTRDEQRAIATYLDIDNYVTEMEAKFIMGRTPLSEWNDFINTLNKMGVQEMIKIRQGAYDRFNK